MTCHGPERPLLDEMDVSIHESWPAGVGRVLYRIRMDHPTERNRSVFIGFYRSKPKAEAERRELVMFLRDAGVMK